MDESICDELLVLSNKILHGFQVGNHVCVNSPGVTSGLANARPPGHAKFVNAPPRD